MSYVNLTLAQSSLKDDHYTVCRKILYYKINLFNYAEVRLGFD